MRPRRMIQCVSMRRTPPEIEDRVISLYRHRPDRQWVAAEVGMAPSTVARILSRRNVVPRKSRGPLPRLTCDEERRLCQAYCDENLSMEAAGRLVGVTTPTVRAVLARNGSKSRGRGRRGRRKDRTINSQGYVTLWLAPDDPLAGMRNSDGRVLEHRLVMARQLDRPLTDKEQVHHRNGIKTDNRFENLQVRHGSHGAGAAFQCRQCGSLDVEAIPIR